MRTNLTEGQRAVLAMSQNVIGEVKKVIIGKDEIIIKVLLSILMGYRAGLYEIPALDGLKQAKVVETVNSWGIAEITLNDWKNCSRSKRQDNMLPNELVAKTLKKINDM